MLYIGLGTGSDNGVVSRLRVYDSPITTSSIPSHVDKAFAKGYHLAHSGLLRWTLLPSAAKVPRVRAQFLAIEAFFMVAFDMIGQIS